MKIILVKADALLMMFVLSCVICTRADAQVTVTCPPAPNQLTVTVAPEVKFDQTTQLFTYTYTVANGANSAQEIDSFNLDFAPPVSNLNNPPGWAHGIFRLRSTLGWSATVPAPLPPGANDDSRVPAGLAQIKPAQSLTGFSFQSPKPPGPVKYFVTGFVDVPPQDDEEGAETLLEQCPQSTGKPLDLAVVGATLGPVNFIPVTIEIKPPSVTPVPINPRSEGLTPVAILGSASFDVSTVSQVSVKFGPGNAAPQKGSGHFEDVNNDGIPDLVFQFSTPAIGVQCTDTALFLIGQTSSGTAIQGSENVRGVGCKF